MRIKPLQKYVLLKVSEYKDTGSIVIPDKYKKKIPKGEVISKGGLCSRDYNIGDTVVYQKQGSKALPNDEVLCMEDRILLGENEKWIKDIKL